MVRFGISVVLLVVRLFAGTVFASDPDLVVDFAVDPTSSSNFTFTGFRDFGQDAQGVAMSTFAAYTNFPEMTGMGFTAVMFAFGPQSQLDPHHHPRANEIFYLISGQVEVGLVDTKNRFFTTTVEKGDLFLIPRGMVHFQRNNGSSAALGLSVLSSTTPGTIAQGRSLFTAGGTGLPDYVLAKAMGIDINTVQSVKSRAILVDPFL